MPSSGRVRSQSRRKSRGEEPGTESIDLTLSVKPFPFPTSLLPHVLRGAEGNPREKEATARACIYLHTRVAFGAGRGPRATLASDNCKQRRGTTGVRCWKWPWATSTAKWTRDMAGEREATVDNIIRTKTASRSSSTTSLLLGGFGIHIFFAEGLVTRRKCLRQLRGLRAPASRPPLLWYGSSCNNNNENEVAWFLLRCPSQTTSGKYRRLSIVNSHFAFAASLAALAIRIHSPISSIGLASTGFSDQEPTSIQIEDGVDPQESKTETEIKIEMESTSRLISAASEVDFCIETNIEYKVRTCTAISVLTSADLKNIDRHLLFFALLVSYLKTDNSSVRFEAALCCTAGRSCNLCS